MSKKPEQKTLTEDQIRAVDGGVSRRMAMKAIGASVVGAGALSSAGCIIATPGTTTSTGGYSSGLTDSDAGTYADPAGGGRGPQRSVPTGLTDSDNAATGAIQDAGGYGRGHHGHAGWQSGLTDSDSGSYADPAGNGRGTARMGYTGITDSDGGPWADAGGHGRGRWR